MKSTHLTTLIGGCLFAASACLPADTVWLDQLDLRVASQGFGSPRKNQSVDGNGLSIGGRKFERGFGTHSESSLFVQLDGKAREFSAQVGVDDEVKNQRASIGFFVFGDGKELWSSGIMRGGNSPKACSIPLTGIKTLELVVTDGGDGTDFDHADWADAKIESTGPETFATTGSVAAAPYILTPPAPPTPRINGASVFGVRPGSPFLFTVPVTGDRPMAYSAAGLPEGLKLDPQSGRITGKIDTKGTYVVTLGAKNAKGQPTRLTPDEQYLHVSLWSLFAAPLLIGCDMEKLDAFTLNLLTNDEVIAVNQDPLGKQATCIDSDGDFRVYVKELEDGGRAVGFCNFGRRAVKLEYKNLGKLRITGRQLVRDLWRQKDLGVIDAGSRALPLEIPAHGVVLHKFSAPR